MGIGGSYMLKEMQEVLEYGFQVLNEVYFESALPSLVISIMSSPKTNGHFTLQKTWRVEEGYLNEINISAEHLDRPIENIMASLCHEMVHYYCYLSKIADVSKNGRYHNKRFKQEAEKRGLQIGYQEYIGYSLTKPSKEFIEVIQNYGIEKPIDLNREGARSIGTDGTGQGIERKKPKCSTRKYICPSCKNSFRATKDLHVGCLDCQTEFVKIG